MDGNESADRQDYSVGDRVEMRKQHPCGSLTFEIYRVGADIGLRCLGCDRRLLLPRRQFMKRVRHTITRAIDRTEGE